MKDLSIYICRKPLDEPNVAQNILKYGTGALNIEAGKFKIPNDERLRWPSTILILDDETLCKEIDDKSRNPISHFFKKVTQ